jgi:hypothetical protein
VNRSVRDQAQYDRICLRCEHVIEYSHSHFVDTVHVGTAQVVRLNKTLSEERDEGDEEAEEHSLVRQATL